MTEPNWELIKDFTIQAGLSWDAATNKCCCAMQAYNFVVNGNATLDTHPWSDLGCIMRCLNDELPHSARQRLKEYMPRMPRGPENAPRMKAAWEYWWAFWREVGCNEALSSMALRCDYLDLAEREQAAGDSTRINKVFAALDHVFSLLNAPH